MRNLAIMALCILFAQFSQAQQDYSYTFFGDNLSFVNPGAVGTKEYSSVSANFRRQWIGFNGSPTNGGLTFEMPLHKKNMGVGTMVYQDKIGVTNTTNISALYSYHLKLDEKQKLSFGINAGADIVNTRNEDLIYWDENDQVFDNNYVNQASPRIGAGVFYYFDKFYAGLSLPRMLAVNTESFNSINIEDSPTLVSHMFLTSGYEFELNENFDLRPSMLLKYAKNVPAQVDVAMACTYKKMLSLGVSYKSLAFVSSFLQYNHKESFVVGYAFDYSTNPLRQYQKGTHEVMLQFRFGHQNEVDPSSL